MKKSLSILLFNLLFIFSAVANDTGFVEMAIREYNNERMRELSRQILAAVGGPDIVGNGTGIVEQNFNFIYRNLDRTISQCLSLPFCAQDENEKQLLKLMRSIILTKREHTHRLIFLRGEHFENFFHDALDPSERIAKTGFAPDIPIFINLTLATEMGIGTDLGLITGILAHEVGHQAGELSHSYLDNLAARMRLVFEQSSEHIELESFMAKMSFIHFKAGQNFHFDETLFFINDVVISPPHLSKNLPCFSLKPALNGRLSNTHWQRPKMNEKFLEVQVDAWVDYACPGINGSMPSFERRNINYKFIFTYKVTPDYTYQYSLHRALLIIEE